METIRNNFIGLLVEIFHIVTDKYSYWLKPTCMKRYQESQELTDQVRECMAGIVQTGTNTLWCNTHSRMMATPVMTKHYFVSTKKLYLLLK